MSLEIGGRADKIGNRYEIRCIIYEMLTPLNFTTFAGDNMPRYAKKRKEIWNYD